MKLKLCIQIILLLITHSVFTQSQPGSPGYSPLPAKIVSEDFKSSTKPKDKDELSISDFSESIRSEVLNIYANYEIDSLGVFDSHGDFRPVNSKFMDLYLIYEYKYRVSMDDVKNINKLIPKILSNTRDQLMTIRLTTYSFVKGKVKSRKIAKKYFQYAIEDGSLLIDIEHSQLTDSYIDIDILIKSRDFITLDPILTDGKYFSRSLKSSLPSFLLYSFPGVEDGYKLVSTSESYFKVLELDRESKDWDSVTKEHSVVVNNKSWLINQDNGHIKPIELNGIDPTFHIDMGFNMIDILK
jgi:hypothetical protein